MPKIPRQARRPPRFLNRALLAGEGVSNAVRSAVSGPKFEVQLHAPGALAKLPRARARCRFTGCYPGESLDDIDHALDAVMKAGPGSAVDVSSRARMQMENVKRQLRDEAFVEKKRRLIAVRSALRQGHSSAPLPRVAGLAHGRARWRRGALGASDTEESRAAIQRDRACDVASPCVRWSARAATWRDCRRSRR